MKTKALVIGKLLDDVGDLCIDWRRFLAVRNALKALLTANSGAGKTHTCRRILEITHGLAPQIIIDPEGEFASLREHFPDILVAGAGGDIPLSLQHPAAMAHRIVEARISVVLDLSELKPKEREAFVAGFLDGLIDSPKRLWTLPTLLLIDEAQMFAPEDGDALSKEAMGSFATRCRKRSIGVVFATLRLSNFSKQVAATCTNNLVGGCTLDLDMKRSAAVLGFGKADVIKLRELETGEFFVYGPAFGVKGVHRIKVGPVLTGHAQAGRRAGKAMAPTAKVKAALAKLAELPREAAQEAQDRASLQAKVKGLEASLRASEGARKAQEGQKPAPEAQKGLQRLDKAALARIEAQVRQGGAKAALKVIKQFGLDMGLASGRLAEEYKRSLVEATKRLNDGLGKALPLDPLLEQLPVLQAAVRPAQPRPGLGTSAPGVAMLQKAAAGLGISIESSLDKNQQKILDTVATLDLRGLSHNREMVARWMGIHPNGGRYGSNLARLRELGLLESQGTKLTTAGLTQSAAGPTGLEAFKAILEGPQRQIVEALAEDRAATYDRESLAAKLGIHPNGGRYGSNIALLRTMGAIPERGGIQLTPEIFR